MERLEEAVQLIMMLWSEPKTTFTGRYYQIQDAVSMPKPIRKPHPPILIGGMGERVTLKLVAKYGDMCNFSPWGSDRLDLLLAALREHCKTVNRDYDSIEKTFLGYCLISDDEEQVRRFNVDRGLQQGKAVEEYLEQQSCLPGAWAGPPEQVIRQYQHLVNMGFSHFQVMFPYGQDREQSRKFARMIIPKVS